MRGSNSSKINAGAGDKESVIKVFWKLTSILIILPQTKIAPRGTFHLL
jgi:hypothetical protein